MHDADASLLVCRSAFPGRPERRLSVTGGANVFDVLRANNQPIASSCTGATVCARCIVQVLEGAELLEPCGDEERELLDRRDEEPAARLACRCVRRAPGAIVLSASYW